MPGRVLVAGPPQILEAVRCALPELQVLPAPSVVDSAMLFESDCAVVEMEDEGRAETWRSLAASIPLVRLLLAGSAAPPPLAAGDIPAAHVESPGELRLAVRTAVLEHRVRSLSAELQGTWAHDARGALGVARLALELIKAGGPTASPVQKLENGVMRLGFLLERLPFEVALALELSLPEQHGPTLFPSLESYVKHLRLVHSQRTLDLLGGEWAASEGSRSLVPFAAGFTELALLLSPPRAELRFAADRERGLEVECECAARPPPYNAPRSLDAHELSRRHDGVVPYRLAEAARLSLRSGMLLTVELTERGLLASVRPSGQATPL